MVGGQAVIAQHTSGGQAFPLASPIRILSPANITYSSNKLNLTVTFTFLLSPKHSNLSYSLDGKDNVTVPLTGTQKPREVTRTYANGTSVLVNSTFMVPFTIIGKVALPELSEGQHEIIVYARHITNQVVGLDESAVHFTVSNNSEHKISTNSEQEIPEFPSWTILPIVVIVALIAIVLRKKIDLSRRA